VVQINKMSLKRLKHQKLKKKLYAKSRLIILNEDTFEEIFSLPLTLMNVFVVATLGAIIIITFTTFLIAFTPLREYIPGYASSELRQNAVQLAIKSDSLSNALKKNEAYLQAVKKVLNGQVEYANVNKDSILSKSSDKPNIDDVQKIDADKELRDMIANEEKVKTASIKRK
jgi:hypothetical protein